MGIFSRLTDIINANINSLLDRAEDPAKLIRLIIQEMEDTLVEVRSSTVKTIAERKDIERRVLGLRHDIAEWQRKAELAMSRGREDLAKGALMAKAKVAESERALATDLAHLDEALGKTSDDIAKLQAKLADAKTREQALAHRQATTVNRIKVRERLHDDRLADAFARFEQVERNLDALEGKAESFDLGRRKTLADEFAELEVDSAVDQELADLKARLKSGGVG
ncbi:MAG: phage shock protein PspA [Azospirillaceae bacterium]|nr:phage shock protein PspA [Azospirillaceae bacterium]